MALEFNGGLPIDRLDIMMNSNPRPNPVVVVEYDSDWPKQFERLKAPIGLALGNLAAAIEHVGSTAVPGLAAKSIIDIDVLLHRADDLPAAIERLARLGYQHQGDLGIPDRHAFATPANVPARNLYVCPPNSAEFRRHVTFRNYLRSHPADSHAYGDLKYRLAGQFRDDRTAYVEGKSEFIQNILRLAR
jgi:GrpB-like predicted nucleotidyltransferase (UPF0157 family)